MKRIAGLHVLVSCERAIELAMIARDEGVAVIQLRDKLASDELLLRIGEKLRAILPNTTFIVNDRADIALAVEADGVHLGQADLSISRARELLGPGAIIGVSTSSIEQALNAEQVSANYLGFGHVFPTRSKIKESAPRSVNELSNVIAAVSIPVIAIGGITESNVNKIQVHGLGGVAVISAISDSENPRDAIQSLIKLLKEHNAIYA